MAKGSSYCSLCVCIIAGCVAPRHKGSLCSAHKKRLAKVPLAVRLTRAARRWLLSLIPCDVTDFVRRFSRLRHNVPLLFMSALLKERDAVTGMLGRLPNLNKVTAAQLQAAFYCAPAATRGEAVKGSGKGGFQGIHQVDVLGRMDAKKFLMALRSTQWPLLPRRAPTCTRATPRDCHAIGMLLPCYCHATAMLVPGWNTRSMRFREAEGPTWLNTID